jgi:2-polyprenyl-3-methyl-5-hydroxy-6-metoxy-1,4-benzoquinol methylase
MTSIHFCPICGGSQFTSLSSCVDYTVSHETFDIVCCANCDFTLTSPRPANERLGKYYQSENYISHSNKAVTLLDQIYLVARNFTLKWKVSLLQKYHPSESELNILDYGCGTGEFLKACQASGFKIAGVEPSENARTKSSETNRIKIHESIDQLDTRTFNIITMWHVLEHIPDFETIIQKLKTKLSDDGVLFIAVPNHKSFDAQLYKQFWAGFDVPRHLWHFSPDTMKKVLVKNNLSLVDICGMKLDAYYVSLLSEKYKSGNNTTLKGYINAVFNGIRSNWKARKTGDYSSLIYIVKK